MNRYKFSRLIVGVSLILLLSLSLLFVTTRKGIGHQEGIQGILVKLDQFFAQPTQYFSQQKENAADLLTAYHENQELKQTLSTLEGRLSENDTLRSENERLRASLEMTKQYPDKQFVSALVRVRTPLSWTNQVMIDAGSSQAITKDMLVMANGGLVGIVEDVQEESATVKLLTNADDFTKIPVKIKVGDKAIYGILSGYDTDQSAFIISQLNSLEDIPEKSQVVTSDLAGATPSNLAIGQVLSVHQKKGSFDRELFIQPAASFEDLHAVLVVGESNG